jgi:hypothetical protein
MGVCMYIYIYIYIYIYYIFYKHMQHIFINNWIWWLLKLYNIVMGIRQHFASKILEWHDKYFLWQQRALKSTVVLWCNRNKIWYIYNNFGWTELFHIDGMNISFKFCLVYIFRLLSKNESRLISSPVGLSVCPPLITSELLGRFSWNLVRRWCHSRGTQCNYFWSHSFNHFKIIVSKIC